MSDAGFKDLFAALPTWARHSISICICSGFLVGSFFLFIANPLEAAAAEDARQDQTLGRQQSQLDRMSDAITTLSQTQAVQAATIANMQRQQDHTDTSLDRIEGKIDQMRRGR
jgi:hypothetical protein